MKCRIYIDEVGNSDLNSSIDPNHRFLCLCGVIVSLEYVADTLHKEMEALKIKYFSSHPDDPIIFHRKEMVNRKPPFDCLRNEEVATRFDNDLLQLLNSWQYTVVSVCLDKQRHQQTYTTWKYDPYHYCLAVLIERFVFFLDQSDGVGDVLAESRAGKEDRRLKDAFHRLWEKGTDYLDHARLQRRLTSSQLKVKTKSNNISGLQLADMIAHPSRNEILLENDLLGKPLAPFAQRIVEILQKKYYRKDMAVFGKKLL